MPLKTLVEWLKSRPAIAAPTWRVPPQRVFESTTSGLEAFPPRECYLEVRLAQLHLRDRREWWREFVPMTTVVTEFQHQGGRISVPIVQGPSTYKDKFAGDGPVDVYNTRVAGPVPYAGDDVGLFVGLSRTVRVDWAERAFELLEAIAKQLDVTRISSFVSVAAPVAEGVERLLGMEKTESRLAIAEQLVAGSPAVWGLRPGWLAVFSPDGEVPTQQLCVHNDRLCTRVDGERGAFDYTGSDFLLVHVRALGERDDYEQFDFHTTYWQHVQNRLWDYQLDAAAAAWELLVSSLMQCGDLLRSQRRNLYRYYQGLYDTDLETARTVHDGTSELDSSAARREVTSNDLVAAATAPAAAVPRGIEMMLDAAGA